MEEKLYFLIFTCFPGFSVKFRVPWAEEIGGGVGAGRDGVEGPRTEKIEVFFCILSIVQWIENLKDENEWEICRTVKKKFFFSENKSKIHQIPLQNWMFFQRFHELFVFEKELTIIGCVLLHILKFDRRVLWSVQNGRRLSCSRGSWKKVNNASFFKQKLGKIGKIYRENCMKISNFFKFQLNWSIFFWTSKSKNLKKWIFFKYIFFIFWKLIVFLEIPELVYVIRITKKNWKNLEICKTRILSHQKNSFSGFYWKIPDSRILSLKFQKTPYILSFSLGLSESFRE